MFQREINGIGKTATYVLLRIFAVISVFSAVGWQCPHFRSIFTMHDTVKATIAEQLRRASEAMQGERFEECVQDARAALELFVNNDDSPEWATLRSQAHCMIARASYRLGNIRDAYGQAEIALSIAVQAGCTAEQAGALLILGTASEFISEYADALNFYRRAIALFESLGDRESRAIALGNMGLVYRHTANYNDALEYALAALDEHIKLGMDDHAARVTGNIGVIYGNLDDYERALDYLFRALEKHTELNRRSDAAKVLSSIGNTYHDISDYPNALKYMFAALDAHREIGNKVGIAATLGGLGVVYADMSFSSAEACEYTRQAREIFREIGMRAEEAIMLCNIGNHYRERGEFELALSPMQEALEIHREIGALSHIARDLENIGLAYLNLTDYCTAERCFGEAAAILSELGLQHEYAHVLANLGMLRLTVAAGEFYNPAKAEEDARMALAINRRLGAKKDEAVSHRLLAVLCKAQRRWEEYAEHIEKFYELEREVASEEIQKQAQKFQLERKIADMKHQREIEHRQAEAERREFEQSLERQRRELERNIGKLVEKNRFLTEITADLREIRRFARGEGNLKADELMEKIRRNVGSLESLGTLEQQMNDVHREFIVRIQEQYPALTPMEVKIAVLLRMNLTSPNIASLLYISHRTVELHRARLRRKIGLKATDSVYLTLEKL